MLQRSFFFFLCLMFLAVPVPSLCSAEEPAEAAPTAQKTKLTVSKEALSSLEMHLPEEKFNFLEEKIIGKEFDRMDFSLFSEQDELHFTADEIKQTRLSLELYFEMLRKIRAAVPSVYSINKVERKLDEMQGNLGSLMKEEQEEVAGRIDELKAELKEKQHKFKEVAEELDLSDLTVEKLPGMLTDLGYEGSDYDIIYKYISLYLGLIKKVDAAGEILRSLKELSKSMKQVERDLKAAESDGEKEELKLKIDDLNKRKQQLEKDFTSDVTGIDVDLFREKEKKKISIDEELNKIFSPVIMTVMALTESSRKMESLRSDIVHCEQHLPAVGDGLAQIKILLNEVTDPELRNSLLKEQEIWQQREKELTTKLEISKQQLIDLQNKRYTPIEVFSKFFQAVFSRRGVNIMFAVVVFCTAFILMHLVRYIFLLINPFDRIPKLGFMTGVLNVSLYLLTFVFAFLSTIVYLYMVGEILTLIVVVMLLFVIILAMKQTLPHFVEEIRLLLGYGPVRQGEKVVYNGISWQIQSIGIYSRLTNPLLAGGSLRLPIKDLEKMRSRAYDKKDPWFPTRKGDWILLADGSYGQVILQSPDTVQISTQRGSCKSYLPADFLGLRPQNLSINDFSVNRILKLDFRHSNIALKDVPGKVKVLLKEAIEQQEYSRYLKDISVDLNDFDNSSLNIRTNVQFSGQAASEYFDIGRLVQQVALDACNTYGWQIAFQQVMLHQAEPYEIRQVNPA